MNRGRTWAAGALCQSNKYIYISLSRLREKQPFFHRTFSAHRKDLLFGGAEEILHHKVLKVGFSMALDTNLF
jgi:hypothetical protein